MTQITMIVITLITMATAAAALGHEQHAHESYSAGEPGNPKRPSRTIEVEMSEMAFAPSRIEVKRGEQIRFVIRNVGNEVMSSSSRERVRLEDVSKHVQVSHFAIEYRRRRELALRAAQWKQLYDPLLPTIFLAWAARTDIPISS